MKTTCLIPAAGRGTRVRPLSHTLPKAMLPIAGKPTIFHIIDAVVAGGVTDFIIISGYLRELLEEEVLRAYPHLHIEFVEQKSAQGLGHACYLAHQKIDSQYPLLIVYGDTLFQADLPAMLKKQSTQIGVFEVKDPRRFGIVETDRENNIKNFIEKPENPQSNLAIPGINFFPQAKPLLDALEHIIQNQIKTKDEYQITDAFAYMLQQGAAMQSFAIDAWYDAGTLEAIFDTNRILLDKLYVNASATIDVDEGKQQQIQRESNIIIPPVYIDKEAMVENSIIGPYVAIGAHAKVLRSTISNSILDENTNVEESTLYDSLCGRNIEIKQFSGKLLLGDHALIYGGR